MKIYALLLSHISLFDLHNHISTLCNIKYKPIDDSIFQITPNYSKKLTMYRYDIMMTLSLNTQFINNVKYYATKSNNMYWIFYDIPQKCLCYYNHVVHCSITPCILKILLEHDLTLKITDIYSVIRKNYYNKHFQFDRSIVDICLGHIKANNYNIYDIFDRVHYVDLLEYIIIKGDIDLDYVNEITTNYNIHNCYDINNKYTVLTNFITKHVNNFGNYYLFIKKIIELGANVNKCDGYGRTPLSICYKNYHKQSRNDKIIELLVTNGAVMDKI